MSKPFPTTNSQLVTRWKDGTKSELVTRIEEKPIAQLKTGEILVRILFVPIHGSFWLASHPNTLHPRKKEFLQNGSFVFGNGGVGKVVDTREKTISKGDYVCIMGHSPCSHIDCSACHCHHRYTECEYNEGMIVGHGKGSNDGTLAQYAILPKLSWTHCYAKMDNPTAKQLRPLMFSFLFADVRNALTRNPESLTKKRMLLFGAGYSGHLAAYLYFNTCKGAKIFLVETNRERAESLRSIAPDAIRTYVIENPTGNDTIYKESHLKTKFKDTLKSFSKEVVNFFNGYGCDLLMDCSSGNTSQLWGTPNVLSPGAHCILFGFGIENLRLNKDVLQLSGLNIITSRGVGNLSNRHCVVETIKLNATGFIENYLVSDSVPLYSIESAEKFIHHNHYNIRTLENFEHAYLSFM